MSIFDSIKNAIFGHAVAVPTRAAPALQEPAAAAASPPVVAPSPIPVPSSSAAAPVDIETVLDGLNAKSAQKLNWRTSIVDLLKLLDMDSSLEHRKALAKELSFPGDLNDSAAMNVWLHKQVMKKLQESGGKVPASLA